MKFLCLQKSTFLSQYVNHGVLRRVRSYQIKNVFIRSKIRVTRRIFMAIARILLVK